MNDPAAASLPALLAAALAVVGAVVIAVVITGAVVVASRRARHAAGLRDAATGRLARNNGEPATRVRFPARALERAVVTGVVAVAVAVIGAFAAAFGVEPAHAADAAGVVVDGATPWRREVWLGAAAVAVGVCWTLWRGSFLSLHAGGPRG